MFESFLNNFIADISSTFTNPQKRVFAGYLFSAMVIAVLWLVLHQKQSLKIAFKQLLSKTVWWSTSSKLDYKIFLINKVFAILLSPLLLSQIGLASIIYIWLHETFSEHQAIFASSALISSLSFTSVYFILDDFSRFYVHRIMHRWPILWAFHQVHHSAEQLTPLTIFRTHPIEMILFSLRSTIVQAFCISTFVFFAGESISLTTILGANIFVFAFNIFGANLRHSHIPINYPYWAEKILISPAQHQIHHSIDERHYDKNFGVILSIWDRMFGSFHHSENNMQLSFGLVKTPVNVQNLKSQYFSPFLFAWNSLTTKIRRRKAIESKFFTRNRIKKSNFSLLQK